MIEHGNAFANVSRMRKIEADREIDMWFGYPPSHQSVIFLDDREATGLVDEDRDSVLAARQIVRVSLDSQKYVFHRTPTDSRESLVSLEWELTRLKASRWFHG